MFHFSESRSGAYYLKTEKGGVAHTYCHMDVIPGCGGGGWTLVMKIDGNKVGRRISFSLFPSHFIRRDMIDDVVMIIFWNEK